ncbi:MAG TPA: alpha-amylase family glycosyl hydrolase [Gemmatimonadaceae bacterium]|nr:alpha-amylase family glycosyl hydrolase [Gemmatimonadaceae bacterium]
MIKLRLATLALIAACSSVAEKGSETESASAVTPPDWTRSAVIYEVNVRQYTPEGTLAALQRHLPRLDSLGVDILWLMPVQPIGKARRKGVLGSYYSIADYTAINPEFGKESDFKAFVAGAHQLGMRVILDWVANHSAFDHEWIRMHPGWYVRRADGEISNARDNEGRETDWTDVAELNYDVQDMRRAMIAEMRWWVADMDIDGFRCDVAGGVPNDFWAAARRELSSVKPDIFLLAEAESPAMHANFDMTYGWELHHLINEIATGKQTVTPLWEYFAKQERNYPPGAYRMYFTSNHDENSWQGTEFERMGRNHLPAFVLSATVKNSMPLLYTGQEASLRKRLRFFEKDTVDWKGPSLAAFYRSVFELKDANRALWNGAHGGDQRILALENPTRAPAAELQRAFVFTRTRDDNTVLVAVNFADTTVRVVYRGLTSGAYTDWFTKSQITLVEAGPLDIPANGFRVLVRNPEAPEPRSD